MFLQIMLVDDEESTLDYLENLICELSDTYQVVAKAPSGLDALALLEIVSPELIISDIKMPEMDGLTMLKLAQERGWQGKSVVVSGYDDFPLVQEALRIGVWDYLLKPVGSEDLAKLFAKLESVLLLERERQQQIEEEIRSKVVEEFLLPINLETFTLPDYLGRALAIIQESYCNKITLPEIARQVGVSPAYLSYSFRKFIGESVVDYITRLRIEASKCLLRKSSLQIQEVATTVGYEDARYFARVFRKLVGCSPTEYREKCKKLLKG
ncbi:helix-turn-helix domain-containing protein [Thermatribacter velox]|uniref:Helix-turn-helix domain-containing protein n=1 Tax=Thermatribacter velox TaxID=3039681 RepID=A0ABZ2YBY3_9BACT